MEKLLSDSEAKLFNYLNKKNLFKKNKFEAEKFIKSVLNAAPLSNYDPSVLLYLYRLLYNRNGNYEKITLQDLAKRIEEYGTRTINGKHIKNFISKKIPFKASNMSGTLKYISNGDLIYLVKSYNSPIYLYRDGIWFFSKNSREAHHWLAYPKLDVNAKLVPINIWDMYKILRSGTPISNEELLKKRKEEFTSRYNSLIPTRKKNINLFYYHPKIKFKVTDIQKKDDDTIEIVVTIFSIYNKYGPLKYEDVSAVSLYWAVQVKKTDVEEKIIKNITKNLHEYLPPQKISTYLDIDQIPEDGYIKIVFDHKLIEQ
jgi:hypothetical protein